MPVELALCINEMISRTSFTLEYLNRKISTFPYKHSDRLDKPKTISKHFAVKKKKALVEMGMKMVGSKVPEGDGTKLTFL